MRIFFYLLLSGFACSCGGTIKTTHYQEPALSEFRKAYIVSSENSQYVQFKFGTMTPFGYMAPIDDPAEKHGVIGFTASIIKQELEKHGIQSMIGEKGDMPEGFDLIIEYYDVWRWDFKNILEHLDIFFIAPEGNLLLAKSTFRMYTNKELHNFPSPEKEVPRMIRELLNSENTALPARKQRLVDTKV